MACFSLGIKCFVRVSTTPHASISSGFTRYRPAAIVSRVTSSFANLLSFGTVANYYYPCYCYCYQYYYNYSHYHEHTFSNVGPGDIFWAESSKGIHRKSSHNSRQVAWSS